ncbi:MAG: RDD family protein [Bdellovibrionota bacterium]
MMMPSSPNTEPTSEVTKLPRKPVRTPKKTDISNILYKRNVFFIEDSVGFRSGSQKRAGFKLTMISWMSAFIDGLVLISISCFSLIVFSILMKTQISDMIKFTANEPNVTKMFFCAFIFSFWVYLVMMRVFMGASLGEWSCHLRLGQPTERMRASYIFRVIGRTTLILLTGVVALPLISLILKKDLVGNLSGLKVHSLL